MCFGMNSKFDCFEIMMGEVFKRCPNCTSFTILKSLKLLFFINLKSFRVFLDSVSSLLEMI